MRQIVSSLHFWFSTCQIQPVDTKMAVRRRCAAATAVCLLATLFVAAEADMFTAIVDLERLLYAERAVADDLRLYIEQQQQKLERLKKIADDFEAHSAAALDDPERHLGNPVNAFLLIKRFTIEWEKIVNTEIRNTDTEDFLTKLAAKTSDFPDQEDLTGAAEALLRLQDTYALDTHKVAQGNLMGVKESPHFTAEDCFRLGAVAYAGADYYHTVLWMTEAMDIHEKEEVKTIDKPTLFDYLSYALYMQGNVRHALNLTKEWLQLEPSHVRAQTNKFYYEQIVTDEAKEFGVKMDIEPGEKPVNNRPANTYKASAEFQTYERLCRGEQTQDYVRKHELHCRYMRHHPMFYIKPIKQEILYLDPVISMFYDVITHKEMGLVRQLARPRLERSVVYHTGPAGTYTAQNYRISKSAWLSDNEGPLITRISQKAGAIANLTLDTAEQMQVLNYGIGGHYEPHYDFSQSREMGKLEQQSGNRVATFLCYATDVAAGGATVFPEIGVQLWPKLGSCVLWYNIQRSGAGDMRTRHAACPVLSGTKWVCNKWFHERGQEFIRPCSTSFDE